MAFYKVTGRDDATVVEFTGKEQRKAKVHQYGLKDRSKQYSEEIQYFERQLLGIHNNDKKLLMSLF
ncbi:phage virion morphogenesis protein [Enterobacteriaceae bacterium C23F]